MIRVATDPCLIGEHDGETVRRVGLAGFEEHDVAGPILAQAGGHDRAGGAASDDQNIRALVSAHERSPIHVVRLRLLVCAGPPETPRLLSLVIERWPLCGSRLGGAPAG